MEQFATTHAIDDPRPSGQRVGTEPANVDTPTAPQLDELQGTLFQAQTELRDAATELGWTRLLLNVADTSSAPMLHTVARARIDRAARAVAALAAALALAVGCVVATPAGHAQAAVLALTPAPVKVVLAGPLATLSTQVYATASTTAGGAGRYVAVSAPIGGRQVRVATATSVTPVVRVQVTLPSAGYTLGRSQWMVRDLGDATLSPLPVDARQASRFAAADIEAALPGYIAVTGALRHYKATAGTWVASRQAPVQVQVYDGTSWTTLATLTTDTAGAVTGLIAAPPGVLAYRLTRPDGAQVWGTTTTPAVVGVAGGTLFA